MSGQSLTKISPSRVEAAYAKLNLGLVVLSRRQDGFHDLRSLFQTVDLHDRVVVTPGEGLELHCSDPDLPAGAGNLAWRAADLYLRETGGAGARIELEKRIPAGAGLGGGSADAAAVLRGLDRLNERPLGRARLAEMGADLGSDVPFAVHGGTMLVEGRGERLTPVTWRPSATWHCVLVCPDDPVDTAWAYGELARRRQHATADLSVRKAYSTFVGSARGGFLDAADLWSVLTNDFQPLIEGTKPIVANASLALAGTFPRARSMSGTGSTVFGIYDDRIAAEQAASTLQAAGHPVFVCTPVAGPSEAGPDRRDND